MQRESQPDGRYHRAPRRLGGYPDWTHDDVEDANAYMAELAEADKDAQRAGSEIEVALNDPRWLIKKEVAGTLSRIPANHQPARPL